MNVISIDFSKYSTGVFTRIDGKENSLTIENRKGCSQEEALLNLYTVFRGILENVKYDFGLIEGYGFNPKNKKSMVPMSEIGGVIKLAFAQVGIPIITIPIQTWKMLTIGQFDKNSYTTEYLAAIKFKYEREFMNTDEADSFLIYQAAKEICRKTKRLTPGMKKIKEQLKVIIEKGK